MELAVLLEEKRTISINVGPGEVSVTYLPGKFTPPFEERLAQLTIPQALAELVVEWGFTDTGKPVPVSAEAVAALPDFARLAIWQRVREDQVPNLRASSGTASGS